MDVQRGDLVVEALRPNWCRLTKLDGRHLCLTSLSFLGVWVVQKVCKSSTRAEEAIQDAKDIGLTERSLEAYNSSEGAGL